MRVKLTLEVKLEGSGSNPSVGEMDKLMRGCIAGIMDKYRGKIDGIHDTYNSVGNDPQFYGSTTKAKTFAITEDEDNKIKTE